MTTTTAALSAGASASRRETESAARTAVIIPCLDEERTIARVLDEFRRELPDATLVVVDNASKDRTAEVAAAAGAVVLRERRTGKGHAVRKALRIVDADVYLLVDGDGTYPAADASRLVGPILDGEADGVIGARLAPRRPHGARRRGGVRISRHRDQRAAREP